MVENQVSGPVRKGERFCNSWQSTFTVSESSLFNWIEFDLFVCLFWEVGGQWAVDTSWRQRVKPNKAWVTGLMTLDWTWQLAIKTCIIPLMSRPHELSLDHFKTLRSSDIYNSLVQITGADSHKHFSWNTPRANREAWTEAKQQTRAVVGYLYCMVCVLFCGASSLFIKWPQELMV